MKLSTAIIRGSKKTNRCEGDYYVNGATCALGAALYGIGRSSAAKKNVGLSILKSEFPIIRRTFVSPVGGKRDILRSIIINLNDRHHWARRRIAKWVAKLEKN